MDWRRVGNASVDLALAGLATGPVERVWYSADGSRLTIRTALGANFETTDFETWTPVTANEPAPSPSVPVNRLPERSLTVRAAAGQGARLYGFGRLVYRSDDGGAVWENLTGFRSGSIVGEGLRDLGVSPVNPDEVVVAGTAGVFRSVDGGKSWSGMNQGLPNLPVARIRSLPAEGRGARVELTDASVVEWQPGEKLAWRPDDASDAQTELRLRQALTLERRTEVTAVAIRGQYVYTGMADGSIQVSSDGRTWQTYLTQGGVRQPSPVSAFWVDPQDPRIAVAVLGAHAASADLNVPVHAVRTQNGGAFWDSITANLPDIAASGVTADRASGAIYVATRQGVFFTRTDLGSLGAASPWTALGGLPQAAAADVKLDDGGHQLWVALEGLGTYVALAPHRMGDPRVVSAADFVARAVAPGSLVSVAGAKVDAARAGSLNVPVLAASDAESQLQVPFEARGATVSLTIDGAGGRRVFEPLPLGQTAPAIFVNRDGAPWLLDADSGMLLDAMHPAHSGARMQILSTGLGQVTPEWPTGMAVPASLDNPPRVVAPMKAWLDRAPVEITRAVLAPGYVGFYLIEVEIPKIVNYGPAELYIEAAGASSNRVRVYIEP
ncbi:MAG TPA: hypothetical protein VN841_07330 [Bryobacteraceae bacterium]|nr:hypothetical protein [Bryobacteraceae bacterium]